MTACCKYKRTSAIPKSKNELIRFVQGYKDSNLEMTESESVALPFGDSPKLKCRSAY